jgi:hypothetical protein
MLYIELNRTFKLIIKSGHGIGYYLSIHEFPPRTRYTNTDPYDEVFREGMFQSDGKLIF